MRLTVTDGAAIPLSGSDTADVTINNANPVVSIPTASSPTACSVSVSADYTDAGTADTHPSGSITWGDGNTTPNPTITEPAGTAAGTVSGSHTYGGSAGTKTITVSVTDDDSGTGTSGALTSFATRNTASTFLAPINTGAGPRSVFKLGSTIPVKITVVNCDGAAVSSLTPVVQLQKLDGVPDGSVNEAQIAEVATNGKAMRWDGAQYIYNLSTKRSQFCVTPAITGCTGPDLTIGTYRLTATDPTFFVSPTATFDLK